MTDDEIREAPALTIDGAPVAVVPRLPTPEMTTAWRKSGEHWQRPTADMDWCSMLSASDPALTAAVVEMREALRAIVDPQAKHFGDATALHLAMIEPAKQARAALARVEVRR